jgi:hypothetical protein
MKWRCVLLLLVVPLAACRKNPPRVDLGVDLYFHPESAGIDDVILQAAIRRSIVEGLSPKAGLVHVRVVDGVVFLTGSVSSEQDRSKAGEIARTIDIRIDGKQIKPAEVRLDRLEIAP